MSDTTENNGETLPKNVDDTKESDSVRKQKIENAPLKFEGKEVSKPIDFYDLLSYPFADDPNRVLGPDGWLTKGSACLWIGESGVGKSSACFQAAICWAIMKPFFGISSVYKPLKSLVLQSEDDIADMGRCAQGITFGYGFHNDPKNLELLRQNVLPFREELRGEELEKWLKEKTQEHKPDLIFINPLLAFCDGDISKEPDAKKMCSIFNSIGKEFGTCFHVFHHTPKPKDEEDAQNFNYAGFGSSYLTNWARAIMVLRKMEEKKFELRAEKRGYRSGLKDANGNKAEKISIKHAEHSVCWLYDLGDKQPGSDVDLSCFLLAVGTVTQWEPAEQVVRNLERTARISLDSARSIHKRIMARYGLDALNTMGESYDKGGALPFWFRSVGKDRFYKLKENEHGKTEAGTTGA